MRILLLTQWYMPEPAELLQELAQSLLAHGHDVTVLTGFPNYPAGELYPGYRLRLIQREVVAGVPVVRLPLYPDHSRSGLLRIVNYVSFALAALFGVFAVRRPDVIFVYHPPLTIGLPAILLSRFWRVPFVYQIQDLWPDTLKSTGMVSNEAALQAVDQVAKLIYREAAAIPVISQGFAQRLQQRGVPAEKIHVISNWVDGDVYHPQAPDPQRAVQLGLAGHFNIMFAGNLGAAQALDTVIEAAQLLQAQPEIQFVFVGDGVALEELKARSNEYGLTNIRFLGRYASSEMNGLYALADVLLVHLRDDPLFAITVPHKIFAYMAVGKPILCAVRGEAAQTVLNVGAGLACPPQAARALVESVLALHAMPQEQRDGMGRCGIQAVRTLYSRDMCTGQLETLLCAVAAHRVR